MKTRRVVVVLGRAIRAGYAVTEKEEISVTVPDDDYDGGFDAARNEAMCVYAKRHSLNQDMVRVIGAFTGETK